MNYTGVRRRATTMKLSSSAVFLSISCILAAQDRRSDLNLVTNIVKEGFEIARLINYADKGWVSKEVEQVVLQGLNTPDKLMAILEENQKNQVFMNIYNEPCEDLLDILKQTIDDSVTKEDLEGIYRDLNSFTMSVIVSTLRIFLDNKSDFIEEAIFTKVRALVQKCYFKGEEIKQSVRRRGRKPEMVEDDLMNSIEAFTAFFVTAHNICKGLNTVFNEEFNELCSDMEIISAALVEKKYEKAESLYYILNFDKIDSDSIQEMVDDQTIQITDNQDELIDYSRKYINAALSLVDVIYQDAKLSQDEKIVRPVDEDISMKELVAQANILIGQYLIVIKYHPIERIFKHGIKVHTIIPDSGSHQAHLKFMQDVVQEDMSTPVRRKYMDLNKLSSPSNMVYEYYGLDSMFRDLERLKQWQPKSVQLPIRGHKLLFDVLYTSLINILKSNDSAAISEVEKRANIYLNELEKLFHSKPNQSSSSEDEDYYVKPVMASTRPRRWGRIIFWIGVLVISAITIYYYKIKGQPESKIGADNENEWEA